MPVCGLRCVGASQSFRIDRETERDRQRLGKIPHCVSRCVGRCDRLVVTNFILQRLPEMRKSAPFVPIGRCIVRCGAEAKACTTLIPYTLKIWLLLSVCRRYGCMDNAVRTLHTKSALVNSAFVQLMRLLVVNKRSHVNASTIFAECGGNAAKHPRICHAFRHLNSQWTGGHVKKLRNLRSKELSWSHRRVFSTTSWFSCINQEGWGCLVAFYPFCEIVTLLRVIYAYLRSRPIVLLFVHAKGGGR